MLVEGVGEATNFETPRWSTPGRSYHRRWNARYTCRRRSNCSYCKEPGTAEVCGIAVSAACEGSGESEENVLVHVTLTFGRFPNHMYTAALSWSMQDFLKCSINSEKHCRQQKFVTSSMSHERATVAASAGSLECFFSWQYVIAVAMR